MNHQRRFWLTALPFCLAHTRAGAAERRFAQVVPGLPLQFPRDHGAHPDFRTEWWYITGQLKDQAGEEFGFQVTFFRQASSHLWSIASDLAPHEFVIAHAAVSDVTRAQLHHDERIARAVLGLAGTSASSTNVWITPWRLLLDGRRYRVTIPGRKVALDLVCDASNSPLLLHGEQGWSRKGPAALQASYYYSRPQLTVTGSINAGGLRRKVQGTAWLDHEWSSEIMTAGAVGWDWIGINLHDGGALMAFQMRDASGKALWKAATRRDADGRETHWTPAQISWEASGEWLSKASGARYPQKFDVTIGGQTYEVTPRFMAQEVDARRTTGITYWEGLVNVTLRGAGSVGTGYLEMTGYARPVRW
jgi:predicted secreted hydrolase